MRSSFQWRLYLDFLFRKYILTSLILKKPCGRLLISAVIFIMSHKFSSKPDFPVHQSLIPLPQTRIVGPPRSQVCATGSRAKYAPYSGQLREFVRQQAHHCRLCFVGPTVWLSLALMRNGWQVRCCYASFISSRMGQTLWRHGSLHHCLPVPGITAHSVWKLRTSDGDK